MTILLGCIADDLPRGATDLANNLVRAGMRVVQTSGVPAGPLAAEVDAVVVALKSRTTAPAEAVAQSLEALRWLQRRGRGRSICPVTEALIEALMEALGCDFTTAIPAFPDNKRTVFKDYLFAGEVLLNESGMQNHPLTPMTDANLGRVLQAQTRRKVGLIDHVAVARGAEAIGERIAQVRAEGVGISIVDADLFRRFDNCHHELAAHSHVERRLCAAGSCDLKFGSGSGLDGQVDDLDARKLPSVLGMLRS